MATQAAKKPVKSITVRVVDPEWKKRPIEERKARYIQLRNENQSKLRAACNSGLDVKTARKLEERVGHKFKAVVERHEAEIDAIAEAAEKLIDHPKSRQIYIQGILNHAQGKPAQAGADPPKAAVVQSALEFIGKRVDPDIQLHATLALNLSPLAGDEIKQFSEKFRTVNI